MAESSSSGAPSGRSSATHPEPEHVSTILEALDRSSPGIPSPERVLVCVSSNAKSLAVPLPAFFDLFKAVQDPHPYSVALAAKNRRFTTP